jgi:drug/metabolite transporter (DMT)-like permease
MNTTNKIKMAFEFSLLGLLALLWGSSYLFIKIAVLEIPPITLIAYRVAIASVFLVAIMAWRKEQLPRDFSTWRSLLILAFFNSIGAWTILAWGQQYVDSGLASVLNSTSPIFVFLFTLFITRHEKPHILKLLGACLGVLGVSLIVGVDALAGLGQQVLGQLASLTGAVLYACAALYARRFTHLSATVIAASTMLLASLVLIPASLIIEQPWQLSPSSSAVYAASALAILCTGCALLIYFRLLKTIGPMGVASQAYLRAGVGVMLGIIFLGEHITLSIGLGLAAAILGVVAINYPVKKKAAA